MSFPQRYHTYAEQIGKQVADLWLADRLSLRRVRKVIRAVVGDDVQLSSGGYRTTAILRNGVIKVPHDDSAIRSTFTEARIFETVKKNKTIVQHFPNSQLIVVEGMPVILQALVGGVASRYDHDTTTAVERFGKRLGIGDIHLYNYGWGEDGQGIYPIFIDCETSPRKMSTTPQEVKKISTKRVRWDYPCDVSR